MIQTMVSNDGGVTFKPIQRDGEPVKPVARWQPKAPKDPAVRTTKITELREELIRSGVGKEEATDLARNIIDGNTQIVSNTSGVYSWNPVDNTLRPIPIADEPKTDALASAPVGKENPIEKNVVDPARSVDALAGTLLKNKKNQDGEPSISIEEAARRGIGFWRRLSASLDNILGGLQIIDDPFADTQAARQHLFVFNQMMMGAMVNSTKFTEKEQTRVKEFLPKVEDFFQNPKTAATNVKLLREYLELQLRLNNETLPTVTAPGLRKDLNEKNIVYRKMLHTMGPKPTEHFTIPENLSVKEQNAIFREWVALYPKGTRGKNGVKIITPDGVLTLYEPDDPRSKR
jgi:hypothetical protein